MWASNVGQPMNSWECAMHQVSTLCGVFDE